MIRFNQSPRSHSDGAASPKVTSASTSGELRDNLSLSHPPSTSSKGAGFSLSPFSMPTSFKTFNSHPPTNHFVFGAVRLGARRVSCLVAICVLIVFGFSIVILHSAGVFDSPEGGGIESIESEESAFLRILSEKNSTSNGDALLDGDSLKVIQLVVLADGQNRNGGVMPLSPALDVEVHRSGGGRFSKVVTDLRSLFSLLSSLLTNLTSTVTMKIVVKQRTVPLHALTQPVEEETANAPTVETPPSIKSQNTKPEERHAEKSKRDGETAIIQRLSSQVVAQTATSSVPALTHPPQPLVTSFAMRNSTDNDDNSATAFETSTESLGYVRVPGLTDPVLVAALMYDETMRLNSKNNDADGSAKGGRKAHDDTGTGTSSSSQTCPPSHQQPSLVSHIAFPVGHTAAFIETDGGGADEGKVRETPLVIDVVYTYVNPSAPSFVRNMNDRMGREKMRPYHYRRRLSSVEETATDDGRAGQGSGSPPTAAAVTKQEVARKKESRDEENTDENIVSRLGTLFPPMWWSNQRGEATMPQNKIAARLRLRRLWRAVADILPEIVQPIVSNGTLRQPCAALSDNFSFVFDTARRESEASFSNISTLKSIFKAITDEWKVPLSSRARPSLTTTSSSQPHSLCASAGGLLFNQTEELRETLSIGQALLIAALKKRDSSSLNKSKATTTQTTTTTAAPSTPMPFDGQARAHTAGNFVPVDVEDPQRYRDWNELLYSLRGVYYNLMGGPRWGADTLNVSSAAPTTHPATGGTVRNIYIVVSDRDQAPPWLITRGDALPSGFGSLGRDFIDRIVLVEHRELVPQHLHSSALPTFNSYAIESVLHRIPGLSRHYLYFNNDMLLARPVSFFDLFQPYVAVSPSSSASHNNTNATDDRNSCSPQVRWLPAINMDWLHMASCRPRQRCFDGKDSIVTNQLSILGSAFDWRQSDDRTFSVLAYSHSPMLIDRDLMGRLMEGSRYSRKTRGSQEAWRSGSGTSKGVDYVAFRVREMLLDSSLRGNGFRTPAYDVFPSFLYNHYQLLMRFHGDDAVGKVLSVLKAGGGSHGESALREAFGDAPRSRRRGTRRQIQAYRRALIARPASEQQPPKVIDDIRAVNANIQHVSAAKPERHTSFHRDDRVLKNTFGKNSRYTDVFGRKRETIFSYLVSRLAARRDAPNNFAFDTVFESEFCSAATAAATRKTDETGLTPTMVGKHILLTQLADILSKIERADLDDEYPQSLLDIVTDPPARSLTVDNFIVGDTFVSQHYLPMASSSSAAGGVNPRCHPAFASSHRAQLRLSVDSQEALTWHKPELSSPTNTSSSPTTSEEQQEQKQQAQIDLMAFLLKADSWPFPTRRITVHRSRHTHGSFDHWLVAFSDQIMLNAMPLSTSVRYYFGMMGVRRSESRLKGYEKEMSEDLMPRRGHVLYLTVNDDIPQQDSTSRRRLSAAVGANPVSPPAPTREASLRDLYMFLAIGGNVFNTSEATTVVTPLARLADRFQKFVEEEDVALSSDATDHRGEIRRLDPSFVYGRIAQATTPLLQTEFERFERLNALIDASIKNIFETKQQQPDYAKRNAEVNSRQWEEHLSLTARFFESFPKVLRRKYYDTIRSQVSSTEFIDTLRLNNEFGTSTVLGLRALSATGIMEFEIHRIAMLLREILLPTSQQGKLAAADADDDPVFWHAQKIQYQPPRPQDPALDASSENNSGKSVRLPLAAEELIRIYQAFSPAFPAPWEKKWSWGKH